MCGRYVLKGDTAEIKRRFGLRESPAVSPHFNIAPGMMLPVILSADPAVAVLARWGLIPSWAKDPKIGYRMINARAESVAEKSSFKRPLVSSRCLVPASGFYEWQKREGESRPFFASVPDRPLISFAGLYDVWKDAEGRPLTTFTIITTTPNEVMAPIHDRMPVILPEDREAFWMDASVRDPRELTAVLTPYPAAEMDVHTVSKAVNNADNDGPELTEPGGQEELF